MAVFRTDVLVQSWHFGVLVTPVFFYEIRSPSDARGMTLDDCYDCMGNGKGEQQEDVPRDATITKQT